MTATLRDPAALNGDAAARRRIQAAEGGPFLVSDRSASLALHWMVDPARAGSLPPSLSLDRIGGWCLVSLVAYRATATRVAVGDRFAPWALAATPPTSCVAEVRIACEFAASGETAEPGYFTTALLGEAAHAAWVRPDRYGVAVHPCVATLEFAEGAGRLSIHGPAGKLVASSQCSRSSDPGWLDIPDAVFPHETPGREEALRFAGHALDRLAMFTSGGGVIRRAGLWRRPMQVDDLSISSLDVSDLTGPLTILDSAVFLGGHACGPVEGLWVGRPQCVAGPSCAMAWREL